MANLLTERRALIPDSLTQSAGTITATFNGSGFNLSVGSPAANTLFFLYFGTISGVTGLSQSTSVPSVYLVNNPQSMLIGAYYSNGAASPAFGSFVNISGPATSEWITYNLVIGAVTTPPTLGTTTTNLAKWRRVGDSMEIMYNLVQTGAGAAGSGVYLFPIPSGYTIDNNKSPFNLNAYSPVVGSGSLQGVSGDQGPASPVARDASNLQIWIYCAGVNTLSAQQLSGGVSTSWTLQNTTVNYSFEARVPIVNWTATPLKDL